MLTIVVGNTKCKICNLTDSEIAKELDQKMSYSIPGFNFMNVHNNWDGRYRLFTKNHYFPIGLLSLTKDVLDRHQVKYRIQDNREKLNYGQPLILDSQSGFEVRDYQEEVVDIAWREGSGIIRLGTGGGKSLILSKIAGRFNIKTMIYVIGIELLYQMKETLEKMYPDQKIGMIGDGHCDLQKITVSTIWTAATAFGEKVKLLDSDVTPYTRGKEKLTESNKDKIKRAVNEAEMIIIDECQYASSETIQLLHRESKAARHRFLLSGTPWREDNSDILIEAVGGPRIFDMPASELIARGWLVPPRIYFLDVPPKRGLGKTYQEIYQKYVVDNDDRNELIIKAAKKMVVEGRKVLILVTNLKHGKLLLSLLKDDLKISSLDGSNKTMDRLETIREMKGGQLEILIASKIFDQGVDIPELDALILAGSGKSSGRALQRIGRVLRKFPNKKDAIVVDFIDNCKYLKEHTQIRNRIYATEPNFKIIMPRK